VAINSKYIHENLAVHSLRAFAGDRGVSCDICEFTINQTYEYVLDKLYIEGAHIYAFSVYIWNVSFVLRVAESLARIRPDAVIWLGGPEVSYNAETVLKDNPFITGVMRGEGEETFTELVRSYEDGKGIDDIRGITYRDGIGAAVHNGDRNLLDMDQLVFPYTDSDFAPSRIYYYESSRGCPFSCSYCLSSIDKKVRYRSIDIVKKEISYFLSKQIKQVKFVDRTFNCDRRRAYDLWQYIRENDNGITNFHFEISADLLTEDDITLLATLRPGQIQLEIGVQTTNAKTLEAIHRKTDWHRMSSNVKALLAPHNIHIHLDLIAGLPYEDMFSFRKSFNDVYGLKPLQLQLGFLKVLKGTEMESIANVCADGYLYGSYPPYEVLGTPWMSYSEISALKGVTEMIETFYNSRQFEQTMEHLEKQFDDYFDLYYWLSVFYVNHHYDEAKHARVRLYEIMLEFIDECGLDRKEYVPLLLQDAYAREKLKHFPDWAEGYEHTVCYNYERRDPLTYNAIG